MRLGEKLPVFDLSQEVPAWHEHDVVGPVDEFAARPTTPPPAPASLGIGHDHCRYNPADAIQQKTGGGERVQPAIAQHVANENISLLRSSGFVAGVVLQSRAYGARCDVIAVGVQDQVQTAAVAACTRRDPHPLAGWRTQSSVQVVRKMTESMNVGTQSWENGAASLFLVSGWPHHLAVAMGQLRRRQGDGIEEVGCQQEPAAAPATHRHSTAMFFLFAGLKFISRRTSSSTIDIYDGMRYSLGT